jgi:hypothetical protein
MKQPKVLISQYDEAPEFRNFDFVIADVIGIYVLNAEQMGIMLNGFEYILEFNTELYEEIKKNIVIKNLMNA